MLAECDRITHAACWPDKPMRDQAADFETNHSNKDSSFTADDGVNIWSALPEDLMDRIFSYLPLTSILRLRCVCRRWNFLVQSKRFQTALSRVCTPKPWFMLCTIGRASCSYDPSMNKWHTIIRPANNSIKLQSGPVRISPCTSILAVSGSLLCLGNQVAECRVLSICNPITKTLRHLPRMLQVSLIHKVSMIVDSSNNCYKIMVSGENGLPTMIPYTYELLTEVFDSSKNSWKMCGKPLAEAKFGSDPGVWCNNLFYCITELPYGAVVFDLVTETWSELTVQMPSSLASPSLVESCGRLLMIGRVMERDETEDSARKIIIWELDLGRKEWVEIRTAPIEICRVFSAPLAFYAPFVCSGLGNQIYITTHRNPHVLVHDLCRNTWQWLPSDPFFPRRRDFHLVGFPFEPRLDASP
ncbi:hypothetical protein SUGI_0867240 [Cryptomeria japonica]|uniref:F-box/kelch-repeat protein At3g61590 n=1 Tax=Cryptomeria japonica TaxID=3369 RepID=UPI002414A23C|nr:F-box/kelch-repeat protein At3g61590 [Cryptomeria japonica]GLJ41881.1 hypothetical protein SUGI_0867240 [Cryptomeria japonica]